MMAGQGCLPDHDKSPVLWLDDNGMEGSLMVYGPPTDVCAESEVNAGQAEAYEPLRCEVSQSYLFAAGEKAIDLLIGGGAAHIAILKILRDERLALSLPHLVVGAGQLDTRLPVVRNRAEPSGRPVVARGADRVVQELAVGHRLARSGDAANADWIERVAGVALW